jgi:alkylation response protein AidB-like acyl-CoA dehydrogenase
VDLDFTAEQDLLRETLRRTCERHGGLDAARALEDDPVGYSPALWAQLAELGVLGLLIDEQYGGSGMTMVDAAIVYEELGRALVPSPHFVSCVLAAGLIGRAGNAELAARILPSIASGEQIVTVASLEPDRGYGPAGITLAATWDGDGGGDGDGDGGGGGDGDGDGDGDGWRLSGEKVHVPYALAAGHLLVLARSADRIIAVLVPAGAAGITIDQQLTIASDTQHRVRFDGVRVDAADVVLLDAWPAWHDTMLDGISLLAAQAAGGARAALELSVAYANTREQFGKPLAGFQAISHYLADAATAVDGAQAIAWEAAWARGRGDPAERVAAMAKSFACQTFRDVTATAQQIFGGNGFTIDFDIQLFFRRAKSLQLNNWDDRYLNELIAAAVLD